MATLWRQGMMQNMWRNKGLVPDKIWYSGQEEGRQGLGGGEGRV
jgi:hypothetical protein